MLFSSACVSRFGSKREPFELPKTQVYPLYARDRGDPSHLFPLLSLSAQVFDWQNRWASQINVYIVMG